MSVNQLLLAIKAYQENHKLSFIFFSFLFQLCDTAFLMPFFTVSNIFFAYVLNNFFLSFFLLILIGVSVSLIMYVSITGKIIPFLRQRLMRSKTFRKLDSNSNRNSFWMCLTIRLLYLPLGLKEYTILVLHFPFKINILSSIIFFAFQGFTAAGIGTQLHNINEIFSSKAWDKMSLLQKWEFSIAVACIVLTISFLIFVSYWIKNLNYIEDDTGMREWRQENDVSEENQELII